MPSVRSVLCAFVSRQDSIALMCLHEQYIFRIKYVNETTLADLGADQSESRPSTEMPSKARSSLVPYGLG